MVLTGTQGKLSSSVKTNILESINMVANNTTESI